MFAAAITIFGAILVFGGLVELDAQDRAIVDSSGALDWAFGAAMLAAYVIAAVYLLAMRKVAAYIFSGHFLVGLVSTGALWGAGQLSEVDWVGYGFGIATQIIILIYVWHLFRRGHLH